MRRVAVPFSGLILALALGAVWAAPDSVSASESDSGLPEKGSTRCQWSTEFAGRGLGLNVHDLTRGAIDPRQISLLPLGIHDVRVARFNRRLMAIGEQRDEPVRVANAVEIVGA